MGSPKSEGRNPNEELKNNVALAAIEPVGAALNGLLSPALSSNPDFLGTGIGEGEDFSDTPSGSRIQMHDFCRRKAIEPCGGSAAVSADILRVNQVFDLQFRQFFGERNRV